MDNILFDVSDHICTITLNRPDALNAINKELAINLQTKIEEAGKDENIRVIYLTGSGKGFCVGQDLKEIANDEAIEVSKLIDEYYNPIIKKIREIEKPVVCGVNGVAAGAGANLALICDITFASKSSYFIQGFSKIGLIPDSGGTFILPRLIGWQKAAALMMLGEKVSAEEAVHMGMIYKAFPDSRFEKEGRKIIEQLAAMPPKALALTKRALNYSLANDLEKQLDIEEHLQATASQTEDCREGITAFLENRSPVFKGS